MIIEDVTPLFSRVNSYKATQFRKWATTVLKEYLIKGYALNDERLKQGNQLFGKDYFDDLLEQIREIRASERRFYQKITDIYSQCSIDYDKNSPLTKQFYAHVQDKLHYAIHGHTSAELIGLRADASKPNMRLYTYKNMGKQGKVTKLDVTVGKNYLNQEELDNMNRLVSMYLDTAENFARRHKSMTMKDWAERLDGFLEFNAYDVLKKFGVVKRDSAKRHALIEYEKFRVIQDIEFKSDFDNVVDEIKVRKRLPKASDHENTANSGLRFDNRFFIFIISISGCILFRFLQLFIKTLLIALTFLCCKHRQTTVSLSSFVLISNAQSHFRKSGRFTKNKPLHPAGFTTIAWKQTGKKRCNFSFLPRPPKSHFFDCFLGCGKFFQPSRKRCTSATHGSRSGYFFMVFAMHL